MKMCFIKHFIGNAKQKCLVLIDVIDLLPLEPYLYGKERIIK